LPPLAHACLKSTKHVTENDSTSALVLTALGSPAAYLVAKWTNHIAGVTAYGKAEERVRPESLNYCSRYSTARVNPTQHMTAYNNNYNYSFIAYCSH